MTSALNKYIVRYCLILAGSFGLMLAITSLAVPDLFGLGDLLATEVAASPLAQESPLSPLPTVASAISETVEAVPAEPTAVTPPPATTAAGDSDRESGLNSVTPTTTAAVVTVDNTLTWGEMLVSGRISVALVGALLLGLLLTIGLVLARE